VVKDKIEIFKNSRLILGLSVLLIAVFSAGLISKEANRTVQVWAASSNLSPGSLISENDIQKVSVLLPDSSKNYISVRAQIAIVLNKINVGELIPVAAVSASANSFNQRLVPISVAVTDIPLSLNRGDIIEYLRHSY
jgi:flagella basal body P-ring formation protein FlgA